MSDENISGHAPHNPAGPPLRSVEKNGRVIARERPMIGNPGTPDHLMWFIGILWYDGEPMEEIDVEAINKAEARKLVRQIAADDYQPGVEKIEMVLA